MRITVSCPVALIDDANHLAMVLGFSGADALTYAGADWQDSEGNLYACASFTVLPEWITAAQSALTRPMWDVNSVIDMDAVSRAQSALVFSPSPILALPDKLTAVLWHDALAMVAAMGLTRRNADSLLNPIFHDSYQPDDG